METVSDFLFGGTRIQFGEGKARRLGRETLALGFDRVLVMSDPGVAEAGVLAGPLDSLESGGIDYRTFHDVHPNPRAEEVVAAAAMARDFGAQAVVAVGGGSPIDAAKAVAVLCTNGDDVLRYEGEERYREKPLPVVAVPTTAGSASEVTGWSIITVDRRKVGIGGRDLYPRLTVADPALTLSLPREPTAHGGMDVVTHAVEAYLSRRAHPLSDALALGALKLAFRFLPEVAKNGRNLLARGRMLEASIMSGQAFASASLGPVHALAEAAGGVYDLPHGLVNALFLPRVLRHYAVGARKRIEDMVAVCDAPGPTGFSTAVEDLAARCGLPQSLSLEVGPGELEAMVSAASRDQGEGPGDLSPEEMQKILLQALARDPAD